MAPSTFGIFDAFLTRPVGTLISPGASRLR
ncbi:hypothetical protein SAMN05519103_08673 [Rhizobiales bacterium GAS113]|nr:hypothetical protein SAMN05519103_08673 [Rhizobiales bacterium GAS113]